MIKDYVTAKERLTFKDRRLVRGLSGLMYRWAR